MTEHLNAWNRPRPITVTRPQIHTGPQSMTVDEASVMHLREAATRIRDQRYWGSGVTALVSGLLDGAADAIERDTTPVPVAAVDHDAHLRATALRDAADEVTEDGGAWDVLALYVDEAAHPYALDGIRRWLRDRADRAAATASETSWDEVPVQVEALAAAIWGSHEHPATSDDRSWAQVDGLMRLAYIGDAARRLLTATSTPTTTANPVTRKETTRG